MTKIELAQKQLDLMNDIRAKSNINMVTCGDCGTILLHDIDREFDKDPLICFGCKTEHFDASSCPDYWYNGCIENMEFDEYEPEPTKKISVVDVVNVATDLKMNPSIAEIKEVLKYYESEERQCYDMNWTEIVENLLYNCVAPSNTK